MNNQMIYELVNAGCDLRKLSPEFLEKLCGVYETTSTAATPVNTKATRAEAIEALQEVAMNDVGVRTKILIDNLVRDIDLGYTMKSQTILDILGDLSKTSVSGMPRALRLVREALS